MSEHKHDVRVAGCYRCELGADEAIAALTAERDEALRLLAVNQDAHKRCDVLMAQLNAKCEAQVERLTKALEQIAALQDHTIGTLPSTPIALAALACLDADPPREPTPDHCPDATCSSCPDAAWCEQVRAEIADPPREPEA